MWPIATHDMATRVPVKRRLLGEDLVLDRDGSGTVGLLAERWPRRRAALTPGATSGTPELSCNFLQIMENSVDPHHAEWLHGRYGSFLTELGGAGRCRS